jgi:hypothetical protein
MYLQKIATGVVALSIGFASAGTFSTDAATPRGSGGGGPGGTLVMEFEGIAGGGSAGRVQVGDSVLQAGHIMHTIQSGPLTGAAYSTFCVELAQHVGTGVVEYQIVDLTDAPAPGPRLTEAQADAVSAVVANAFALGWIDARLQADTTQTDYLGRMGAIQAAIWLAIGGAVDINGAGTSSFVRDAYLELTDGSTFDPSLRMAGLVALTNAGRQDMLFIVPLPPAAWAGAGLLAVGFGLRAARRRG